MSEPEANNDVNSTTSPALVPVKSEDPTNATKSNGVHETKDPPENDLLLSHVVPPAHILADGRFINLPPPTLSERSAFFERAVAAHRLIKGEDDTPGLSKEKDNKRKRNQKPTNGGSDGADSSTQQPQQQQQSSSSNKKKSKKAADAPFVHPIAIASARLNAKGIDELSKAINLGTLVLGGEYFSLTNVVNQRLVYKKTNDGSDVSDGSKGKLDGTSGDAAGPSSSSAAAEPSIDESILLDQRLRSKYVLRRRQTQYDNASTVLSRHERRLSSSVAVRRILDARLRSLRRKWRLVAPEHGTRTVGPVRPREVVAVDVEVYDRDRLGGGNRATSGGDGGGASSSSGGLSASGVLGHSLGRIARRVPRFATMELDDDYDVTDDILSLRKKIKDVVQKLKSGESEERDVGNENEMTPKISNLSTSDMDTDETTEKPTQYVKTFDGTEAFKTKAEPFAIADPTLGKIDPDFDPDKVPLLTLLFEIEKPSTGFSQCATLSSSFSTMKGGANDSGGNNRQLHPDERVIEALQHSLFCASLFESMRAEIIPLTASNNPSATSAQQKGQKSVVWLSSEMEESFLPPPSVMAGEDTSKSGEARLLCVIHCHEGEVKVQLDDEYSLTVKLIEAGTAAAAASVESSGIDDHSNKQQKNDVSDGSGASGSQTPSQLRTLCRALLLHSQSLYHEHRMKMRQEQFSSEKKELKPLMGFARVKKQVKTPSPHILQSCVGLGCKFIFEKKVRVVLKVLSRWLAQDMKCEDKIVVEWLPLALFDSHSRFAFNFRNICMDIGIYGDVLRVTQICDTGEFKTVAFGSDLELEYFLKLEIRRALNNNY